MAHTPQGAKQHLTLALTTRERDALLKAVTTAINYYFAPSTGCMYCRDMALHAVKAEDKTKGCNIYGHGKELGVLNALKRRLEGEL